MSGDDAADRKAGRRVDLEKIGAIAALAPI